MEKDVKNGKAVVIKEKHEIHRLEKRFDNPLFTKSFKKAVDIIYGCKGKVIVTGIGKSGIIAQKIAATFNSTGTYSTFLHSGDSIHGDLGIVREEDVVLLLSKSGGTDEVKKLIPLFKEYNLKIISITANVHSPLAKVSDIVLDASIESEACPHNLTPTSSSTTALVLGDAIAMVLLQKKGFTKEEFAAFHPGGMLGRKLLLKVKDIMTKGKDIPLVNINTKLKDVIYMISTKRLGSAIVMDKQKIAGMITDGDLRRLLQKTLALENLKAKDIMNTKPKFITTETLANTALEIMERNKITQLIITDKNKKLAGIIHIHTLVEMGL
ncbi:MAG TPA: KpsF/GutQ family sugar-phosphate isomerase [Ignavibacteria bacterium]